MTTRLVICVGCNRVFPMPLMSPLVVGGERVNRCPLCALKIRNEREGLPPGTPFEGEIMLRVYDHAVVFMESQ